MQEVPSVRWKPSYYQVREYIYKILGNARGMYSCGQLNGKQNTLFNSVD